MGPNEQRVQGYSHGPGSADTTPPMTLRVSESPAPPNLPPVRWGVLGASHFAIHATIPAMQQAALCRVTAIASRSLAKAEQAALQTGIPRAYGSYEELISDDQIEAVYIPLANHLHKDWTIAAAEAGKHVLCEKPLALSVAQVRQLVSVQERTGVCIAEAFMIRHHPQWEKAAELVRSGRIGQVRAVQTAFSYSNFDPNNIRNQKDLGGGATYDIGGYAINTARLVFGAEPLRAAAVSDIDPITGCDRLTSALLDFGTGQASFVAGTQHVPFQRVHIFGTSGHLEVVIPFNAPNTRPCRLLLDGGLVSAQDFTVTHDSQEFALEIALPAANHYTLQAEEFSRAVRLGVTPRNDVREAQKQMFALEAVLRAARSGAWVSVES